MTDLPEGIQSAIRVAVKAGIQAIVDDKAMGLENTNASDVPLSAIQLRPATRGNTLYAVGWWDRSFGVNGSIWIIEVSSGGAKNLVASGIGKAKGLSLGGFGVEVLSAHTGSYPELMIASAGFKDGGGAEAEATCVGMRGRSYEQVPCPATCNRNLNDR